MTAQPWPVADASVLAPVPEHEELRTVLRDLLETHAPHDEVRRAAELPEGWSPKLWSLLNEEMEVGSLAVPEERGGQGYGVAVLAVVLEEAGRALLPEPLLLSSVLGGAGRRSRRRRAPSPTRWCSGVMDGTLVVTVALDAHTDATLTLAGEPASARVSGRLDRVPLGETRRPGGRRRRTRGPRVDPPRRPPGRRAWLPAPRSRRSTSPAARPDSTSTALRHT